MLASGPRAIANLRDEQCDDALNAEPERVIYAYAKFFSGERCCLEGDESLLARLTAAMGVHERSSSSLDPIESAVGWMIVFIGTSTSLTVILPENMLSQSSQYHIEFEGQASSISCCGHGLCLESHAHKISGPTTGADDRAKNDLEVERI